eukprot:726649-Rhodomonas_salina.1
MRRRRRGEDGRAHPDAEVDEDEGDAGENPRGHHLLQERKRAPEHRLPHAHQARSDVSEWYGFT